MDKMIRGNIYVKYKKILIPAIKNEIISFAAEYGITLFPDAVYHLVSVIPSMKRRSLYTRLYMGSFRKIAEDAFQDIEIVLNKYDCTAIKKAILKGNPVKEIRKYVKQYKIDLVIITSSATPTPPPKLIGSTATKIIGSLEIPILIITPYSYVNRDKLEKNKNGIGVLCRDPALINKALGYAYYIIKKHGFEHRLRIILPHTKDRIVDQEILRRLSNMGLKVDLTLIRSDNLDIFVEKALKEAQDLYLLITMRGWRRIAKIPFLMGGLSRYERLLIGLSPIPILLV